MNRELKRVAHRRRSLMFLTLFVSSTIIQVVQADALAARPAQHAHALRQLLGRARTDPRRRRADRVLACRRTTTTSSSASTRTARCTRRSPATSPSTARRPGSSARSTTTSAAPSSSQFFDSHQPPHHRAGPAGRLRRARRSTRSRSRPRGTRSATTGRRRRDRAVDRPHPRDGLEAHASTRTRSRRTTAAQVHGDVRRAARRPGRPALQPRDRRRPEPARIDLQARRRLGRARIRRVHARQPSFPNPRVATRCRGTDAVVRNAGGGTCGGGDDRHASRRAAALAATSRSPSSACELGDTAIREQAEKFGFNNEFEHPAAGRRRASTRARSTTPQTALTAFGQDEVRATPLQMAMVSAAIANGGIVMNPNLVDAIIGARPQSVQQSSTPREFGRAISAETARDDDRR